MTATGILAARINRNDVVEVEGQTKTVADYDTAAVAGRIVWSFTDGTTKTVSPTAYVTAYI